MLLPVSYTHLDVYKRQPDTNISPYNKSLTVILSPVFQPNLEPPVAAAFLSTTTTLFKFAFSKIIIQVIIFVVLDVYKRQVWSC